MHGPEPMQAEMQFFLIFLGRVKRHLKKIGVSSGQEVCGKCFKNAPLGNLLSWQSDEDAMRTRQYVSYVLTVI